MDHPFSLEDLTYALRAVGTSVTPDEINTAAGDSEQAARLLAKVVMIAAPHVGATALLDAADELAGVEQPTCSCACSEWTCYFQARSLRERAARMINWTEQGQDDSGDLLTA